MRQRRVRLSIMVAALVLAVVGIPQVAGPRARADSSDKKPLGGGWTQNGSYVWNGTAQHSGSQQAFDTTMTFDWPEAAGNSFFGHSLAKLHVMMNPDGTGTAKGFELFVGSVAGRQGQAIFYNDATIANFRDYTGTALCVGGSDGLKNLTCSGSYAGAVNDSGHWTDGSYSLDG
jgi:hypothetical protein